MAKKDKRYYHDSMEWSIVDIPNVKFEYDTFGNNHLPRLMEVLSEGWILSSFYCPEGQNINKSTEITIRLHHQDYFKGNKRPNNAWKVDFYKAKKKEKKNKQKKDKPRRSVWDLGTGGGEDDAFSLASIQDANM